MLIITISPLGEEGTEIIEGHTGNVKPARRSVMVTTYNGHEDLTFVHIFVYFKVVQFFFFIFLTFCS